MKILALLASLLLVSVAQAAPLPPEIRSTLKTGALSLRFETRNIGPNSSPVGLHLYVVPTARNVEAIRNLGTEPKTGPITRDEIQTYNALKPSPFTLELFTKSNGQWRHINSVTFNQTKDLQEIQTRWLYPKRKTGPVLILHFGYSHWHEWEVITFDQGLTKPAKHQTFLWGGEGEFNYVFQKFDKTDANGKMIIAEEASEDLENPTPSRQRRLSNNIYQFDGLEWRDYKARYFVITASLKTRAEADKALAKQGFGEIRPSSRYSGLKPGYFVIIAGRHADLKYAQEQVSYLKKNSKVDAYVRKAF